MLWVFALVRLLTCICKPRCKLDACCMPAVCRLFAGSVQMDNSPATIYCRNRWTCPRYCDLFAINPNKRCETDGDCAPKHREHAKLETCCHATLLATLSSRDHEPFPGYQPDGTIPFEAQQFYLEVSLVLQNVLDVLTVPTICRPELAGCKCLCEIVQNMS